MERAPVDVERLRHAVGPRWSRVEVVAETASTNRELLADTGAPDHSVLVAEYQSAGRGRLDRTWVSPPGAGLTFSVLLRPDVLLPRWGWLPLLAGVAVSEAVTATCGVPTSVKWPNDLLVDGSQRKLAGVLAQTAGGAVVIGIGLNVSTTAAELPLESATSLALAGAPADLDRTTLLTAILTALDARYAQWLDTGGDAAACGLDAAYRERSATLGAAVRVHLGGDGEPTGPADVVGEAVGLDELGRLLIRTERGVQPVSAGDVQQLRPTSARGND